ncbi:MAG TPA: cytochrome P450 [Gemmatimonadales bacterium]|nr:cytochrome P450 [Gemmatimonadales bacterium]
MSPTAPLSPPPVPRARWPLAHLVAFRRDPLAFLATLAREHGDVASVRMGRVRVVLVNHPDHIKDVLVTRHRLFVKGVGLQRAKLLLGEGLLTSEGELHRRQRRLAQPAFHHQRVMGYGEVMAAKAEEVDRRWQAAVAHRSSGAPARLDVHAEMMRVALAVVGATLFGSDVEAEAGEIGAALATSLEVFDKLSTTPFAELLERLPVLPSVRRFRRARRLLDATIHRMIRERRASGEDRGDLLSMLLLAQDPEAAAGGGMTDAQLRDEAMTIFLAGHETTANALTWTWYLLARHPEVEARLHAELDTVLGARGARGAVPADLARLSYTRMVLAESMRLFPPAWVLGRQAVADFEIGGHAVPRGSVVLMSQWLTQRDARWWPDPERFDPERWREEAPGARPRFAYYPFGAGPRICIGEQFAWMEATLVLATLARRWRLRLAPDAQVALLPSITLRPRFGMPMLLEARG